MMILSSLSERKFDSVKLLKIGLRRSTPIILVPLLVALWTSTLNLEKVCNAAECRTNQIFTGKQLKGNLSQTFDVEVQVSSNTTGNQINDFRDPGKGVGLSWNEQQRLLITVPMRGGSTSAFGYTTPADIAVDKIRVRIENSKAIYFFLNGKIAYSHRYENAPFFVNVENPVATPRSAGKVVFTKKIIENSVEEKVHPASRVGSIIFIIYLFAIGTRSILARAFPSKRQGSTMKRTLDKNLFGLVVFSWGFSILNWVKNPIDTTGALNPGPFGPVGASFSDFFQLSQIAQLERPYDLGGTNYPPTGLLFLRLLTLNDPNNLAFFPIAGMVLGSLLFLSNYFVSGRKEVFIVLASFPFLFGIVRGNLDLFATLLIWVSVLFWRKGSLCIAGLALGIAISLKIWPLVFLALFIKKENKRFFFSAITSAILLTFISSMVFGYFNLFEVFRITFGALMEQSTLGTYAFQNTFSASAILFIGHVLLMAKNPFNVSQIEINNSLDFVNGGYASILLLSLCIFMIYLFYESKKISTKYLILCGIVLSIPTQSFTYRGLIVFFYFYLLSQEDETTIKVYVRNKNEKLRKQVLKSKMNPLKKISTWSAVPLFAPTAFYFVPGTQFSTASLLQPLGLLAFIGAQVYQEKKSLVTSG
jgi:hypothetical protein